MKKYLYYCEPCEKKFAAKNFADGHLHARHAKVEFRKVFAGTYTDLPIGQVLMTKLDPEGAMELQGKRNPKVGTSTARPSSSKRKRDDELYDLYHKKRAEEEKENDEPPAQVNAEVTPEVASGGLKMK